MCFQLCIDIKIVVKIKKLYYFIAQIYEKNLVSTIQYSVP